MMDVVYSDSAFSVECMNLLDNPAAMHFPGYEPLPIHKLRTRQTETSDKQEQPKPEEFIVDITRTNDGHTVILIALRYFEYVCVARMNFWFLKEICKGGMLLVDVVDMMRHHLKNKLIREVKNTEQILDMHCNFTGFIKY